MKMSNRLVGLEQTRNRVLKQYTVGDIAPADDWSLEQSLDTAWNRSELMDSLERLDRRSLHLFEAAMKGGE